MGFSKNLKFTLAILSVGLGQAIEASSILLHGGTITAFNASTSSFDILRGGSLLIVNDRIQSLFPSYPTITLPSDTQYINVTNQIVSPGFIDTHRHGWQTGLKTIGSNTSLPEYFSRFGEYAAAGKLNADDVYIGQLTGILEALNAGVTTILDHAHGVWDDDTADAGLKGSVDSGARVFHACAVHELGTNFTIDKQLAKVKELAAKDLNGTSVEVGLAYDGWASSSTDEVGKVVSVVNSTNFSVITTHFLGGPWANANSPFLVNSLNLLNISTPFVFSHGSFLSTGDAGLLRSTNQYLSTTPESELQYGHGNEHSHLIMDQAALGTDTLFTFSTDMITQARLWLQTARGRFYNDVLQAKWNVGSTNPMSANQALLMATRNGGLALHREDLGVIREGAKADIVVFKGDSPSLLGWADPVAALVLHSNVGDIQHVIVDGKFVKKDGKLTFANYEGIQQKFLTSARKLQQTWKDTPYPDLEGSFNSLALYEATQETDVVRGDGTGYGVDHL